MTFVLTDQEPMYTVWTELYVCLSRLFTSLRENDTAYSDIGTVCNLTRKPSLLLPLSV